MYTCMYVIIIYVSRKFYSACFHSYFIVRYLRYNFPSFAISAENWMASIEIIYEWYAYFFAYHSYIISMLAIQFSARQNFQRRSCHCFVAGLFSFRDNDIIYIGCQGNLFPRRKLLYLERFSKHQNKVFFHRVLFELWGLK